MNRGNGPQRGGSRGGFRAGRGGRRNGGNGNGGGDRNVNGGSGGGNTRYNNDYNNRNADRDHSPERRNDRDAEYNRRNDNYSRHNSRSPSPNRNYANSGYDDRSSRQMNNREDRERSCVSQDIRQMRLDDLPFERSLSRSMEVGRDRPDNIRNLSPERERERPLKVSDKETAGYWKLRLADAEEQVRRAEYQLRRAKMNREVIIEAYKEYTETTIPSELLNLKQPW